MALRHSSRTLSSRLFAQPQALAPVASSLESGLNVEGSRHASNEALKIRMKSVTSIQKITKAMKMVAASKLRGAQTRLDQARGFSDPVNFVIGDPSGSYGDAKNVIVPVTSDKGLCGGINSTIIKYINVTNEVMAGDGKETELVVFGEKGRAGLRRSLGDKFSVNVNDVTKNALTFAGASAAAEEVLATNYDAAHVVFNRFQSAIAFMPTVATVLSPSEMGKRAEENNSLDAYEFEGPEKDDMLADLAEFQLASTLYTSIAENTCSEQGARMQAMDNSTRNATDMLENLTLTYNRGRQAAITTELIEIISGAAALDDA